MVLSEDEVLELAPDEASIKAARELAKLTAWTRTQLYGNQLSGDCPGSRGASYTVNADVTAGEGHCTCPSRKYPCKHMLALLLLWSAGDVVEQPLPEPAAIRTPVAPVSAPLSRYVKARLATMDQGIADFEQWMLALTRIGFDGASQADPSWWKGCINSLNTAQLGGLADRVERVERCVSEYDRVKALGFEPPPYIGAKSWRSTVIRDLGYLWAAVTHWRRREELDDETFADLKFAVGWRPKDWTTNVVETIEDTWTVIGVTRDLEGSTVYRSWMVGEHSGLVVYYGSTNYSPRKRPWMGKESPDKHPEAGTQFTGAVRRLAGKAPYRVLLPESGNRSSELMTTLPPGGTLTQATQQLFEVRQHNPWAQWQPAIIDNAYVTDEYIIDGDGYAMRLDGHPNRSGPWRTWGEKVRVFGEINGSDFLVGATERNGEVVVW